MSQHDIRVVYVGWLWLFTGLFSMRVIAQLSQFSIETDLLPAFEKWQGSSLPYPLLLLVQLVIFIVMLRVNVNLRAGRLLPNGRTGQLLLVSGGVYMSIMAARLVLGFTVYTDNPWFANWIPAVFHMVLACYVLVLGLYHLNGSKRYA